MPRRVKSLKDATLLSIAQNIDYWGDMIPEDPDSYLYLLSPFEVLDHGLTQQLFDALIENDAFIPKHIHLLFHSTLDAIDLSKCSSFKLGENVLKTLLKRCKKIKSLKLSGRTRYSKSLLNSIPSHYQNLRSFTLTHESISDDLIMNLAASCPNLISFQSSSCSKLKEESLKYIIHLQNIQILTLGNADALSNDLLLLLLRKCKEIKQLSLPMTTVDMMMLTNRDIFTAIQTLDFTLSDMIDDNSVQKISTSFPSLKDLCLSNCENVTEKSLEILGDQCKALENLNISYSGIKKYSDVIRYFLIKIGYNLHSVDFSGISDMRTAVIGEYCSHLEKLFLNHCPYMATEWIPYKIFHKAIKRNSAHNDRYLTEILSKEGNHEKYSLSQLCPLLRTLQLDFRKKKSDDSNYDLDAVLHGGCNIKTLGLVQLPQLSDNDIKNLPHYLDVKQIQHLNISGNSEITVNGIWYAIEKMDNLKVIEIRDCDVIKSEFDELKHRIRMAGYDVDLVGHKYK